MCRINERAPLPEPAFSPECHRRVGASSPADATSHGAPRGGEQAGRDAALGVGRRFLLRYVSHSEEPVLRRRKNGPARAEPGAVRAGRPPLSPSPSQLTQPALTSDASLAPPLPEGVHASERLKWFANSCWALHTPYWKSLQRIDPVSH